MKKLILIVESSQRGETPAIAKEYYYGKKSRWINKIVEYLDLTGEKQDTYFLQLSKGDIVGYEELVEPYEKASITKDKINRVVEAIKTKLTGVQKVDLHCGQNIGNPIIKILKEKGIAYQMFAEGFPLAMKPVYYEKLIEEEEEKLKAKELKNKVISTIGTAATNSYERAMSLINLAGLSNKYNIDNLEEIEYLAKQYHKKKKQMEKAVFQLEQNEIADFNFVTDVTKFYADIDRYERLKRTNGKLLAKIELYLVKVDYFKQIESKLDAALLRSTIQLMRVI